MGYPKGSSDSLVERTEHHAIMAIRVLIDSDDVRRPFTAVILVISLHGSVMAEYLRIFTVEEPAITKLIKTSEVALDIVAKIHLHKNIRIRVLVISKRALPMHEETWAVSAVQ